MHKLWRESWGLSAAWCREAGGTFFPIFILRPLLRPSKDSRLETSILHLPLFQTLQIFCYLNYRNAANFAELALRIGWCWYCQRVLCSFFFSLSDFTSYSQLKFSSNFNNANTLKCTYQLFENADLNDPCYKHFCLSKYFCLMQIYNSAKYF